MQRGTADDQQDLAQSQASMQGGTRGSMEDVTRENLKRGYSNAETDDAGMDPFLSGPGGFLGRANGWER